MVNSKEMVKNRVYDYVLYFGLLVMAGDVAAYIFWAGNMLAVNLDNQNNDRYVTLIFWRLIVMAVGIVPVFGWGVYFARRISTGFLFFIALLLDVATIAIQLAAYGWFIVDLVMCSSVVHCYGDGNGPLGIDVAFWVVLVTTAFEIAANTLLLIIGVVVRQGAYKQKSLRFYHNRSKFANNTFSETTTEKETTIPQGTGVTVRERTFQY